MAAFFVALIYASFVSLGLPDAVLGAAWPVMGKELAVPDGYAGFLSMTVAGGTVVSSLLAGRVLYRFGTGRVTAFSVALTAAALLGYSLAPGFGWLLALAVPLGLGAGAVDTGLNNFVALHYSARHMNWLHCFWGLGAMLGPLVLAGVLEKPGGWRTGYGILSGLQWALVAVLVLTLPLWKRFEQGDSRQEDAPRPVPGAVLHLPGAPEQILSYFFYCAIESTTGLWAASWMVSARGVAAATAAGWVSVYYLGITAGRFLSGCVTRWLSTGTLIRLGEGLCMAGMVLLAAGPAEVCPAGLLLIGLGFAPVYPGLMHETPRRFGPVHSQSMIGLQMAGAYLGSTLVPPLFGALAARTGVGLLPLFLLAGALLLTVCGERAARRSAIHVLDEEGD